MKKMFIFLLCFVVIFSSIIFCAAAEDVYTDAYRTDKLRIVVKSENVPENGDIDTAFFDTASIAYIIPVFTDGNGDKLYDVYPVNSGADEIQKLKAELEECEKVYYAGLMGYAADDTSSCDVTLDGRLSADDARFALRCSVGLEEYSAMQLLKGDTDNDRRITASDARIILRSSVGLSTEIDRRYDFATDSLVLSVKEEYMPDATELSPEFFGSDLINDVEYLLGNRSYAVYLKEPGEENLFELLNYLRSCEKVENVDFNWYGQLGI